MKKNFNHKNFKLHLFNSLRNMKVTLSAIKADIGAIGGHTKPSDELVEAVNKVVKENSKLLLDYYIGYTGDDIHIIMTHTRGADNNEIHKMAWNAFTEGTKVAKEQGLYGAGQDLLKDAFSGNVRGMGPGVAEIEIEERPSEVFCVFAARSEEHTSELQSQSNLVCRLLLEK